MIKRRVFTYLILTLLLLASFVTSATTAFSSTLEDIKGQIDSAGNKQSNVQAELDAVNKALNQKQKEYEQHSKEYSQLAKEYEAQSSELDKKVQELEMLYREIEELQNTIVEAEQAYETALDLFYQRTAVIYQHSNYSSLRLFVEAKNVFDYSNHVRLMKDMLQSDRETMEELKVMKKDLDAKKELIEILSVDMEKAVGEKEAAVSSLKSNRDDLDDLLSESRSAIDKLQKQEDALEEESQQIAQQIKSLQSQYDALLAAQNNANGGQSSTGTLNFLWPAPSGSWISSYYGYRTHPISGQWKMHSGIDIPAPGGSNILASESGVVMTAKWNDSYGYYVVIYHGNGFSTLYAHSCKLLVKVGDNVTRGQVIALVGTTGSSTGNHVHFEVRIDGSTRNPLDYLK